MSGEGKALFDAAVADATNAGASSTSGADATSAGAGSASGIDATNTGAAYASTLLAVDDVRFAYHAHREVLKGVSFCMSGGDILCLLGSNGTGKTTLLRCMLGFNKPTGGSIAVAGRNVFDMRNTERAKLMAYVPQSSSMAFPYRAAEVVLMGRVSHLSTGARHTKHDHAVVADSMRRLQIEHLADRRYQELSGGEKQMVLVARALAQEARLLVMDEPTANLDYHNQVKILAAIRYLAGQGLGILMTSHYPDHAFLACSKVALMKGGRVVAAGDPDAVVTSESLTYLYDTPVHVARTEVGDVRIKTCIPLLDETALGEASATATATAEPATADPAPATALGSRAPAAAPAVSAPAAAPGASPATAPADNEGIKP